MNAKTIAELERLRKRYRRYDDRWNDLRACADEDFDLRIQNIHRIIAMERARRRSAVLSLVLQVGGEP